MSFFLFPVPALPTVGGEVIMFTVVCSAIHCLSINAYFMLCDISLLSGWNSMKLATNIPHMSGHCCRGFYGQRSGSCV